MKPLDALEEVLADVHRGALSEQDALDRVARLVDHSTRDGRAEVWFNEHVNEGCSTPALRGEPYREAASSS